MQDLVNLFQEVYRNARRGTDSHLNSIPLPSELSVAERAALALAITAVLTYDEPTPETPE